MIALSQLANVYHLFQHVENSEAVAAHVVAELCKFIERYYTPGIKKEFIEDVVVEAFFCTYRADIVCLLRSEINVIIYII